MNIILAYLCMLIIWSTTPLAIQWSSEGGGFLFSVAARMSCASLLSVALVLVLEKRLPLGLSALASYFSGGVAVFGAVLCVYWAAQFVPSGMIAIFYGMAPVLTGVMAYCILGERFSGRQLIGVLLSLFGLLVVYADSVLGADFQPAAMLALLASVSLYCLSGILVKHLQAPVSSLQQTAGTLLCSSAAYISLFFAGYMNMPTTISTKALLSLSYLVVVCSVLGFFLYFYALKVTSAGSVSLTTLVTPLAALSLGIVLNGESFGLSIFVGTLCIVLGLMAYQWPHIATLTRRLLNSA